jgi:hypothetical protein
LASVRHFDILCINKLCQIAEDAYVYVILKNRITNNNITNLWKKSHIHLKSPATFKLSHSLTLHWIDHIRLWGYDYLVTFPPRSGAVAIRGTKALPREIYLVKYVNHQDSGDLAQFNYNLKYCQLKCQIFIDTPNLKQSWMLYKYFISRK